MVGSLLGASLIDGRTDVIAQILGVHEATQGLQRRQADAGLILIRHVGTPLGVEQPRRQRAYRAVRLHNHEPLRAATTDADLLPVKRMVPIPDACVRRFVSSV
jgi:hypothetical protein